MISIYPASSSDCEKLTNLAIRFEAYWGYDSVEKYRIIRVSGRGYEGYHII